MDFQKSPCNLVKSETIKILISTENDATDICKCKT